MSKTKKEKKGPKIEGPNTVSKVFALYVADLGLIPAIPCGLPSPTRSDPWEQN